MENIQGFQGLAVAIAGEVYKLPSLLGFFTPLSTTLTIISQHLTANVCFG